MFLTMISLPDTTSVAKPQQTGHWARMQAEGKTFPQARHRSLPGTVSTTSPAPAKRGFVSVNGLKCRPARQGSKMEAEAQARFVEDRMQGTCPVSMRRAGLKTWHPPAAGSALPA